jgi:hypothetical protein
MKILSYILILTGMLFFGCSSISVTSDYDPASNFTGYKTFAVSEKSIEGSALEQAPLIKKRVVDAVKSEMRKKGMVATHEDKADLVVYPFATTKDKINVTDWGYSYGAGYWGRYPYGRNIDVSEYTEATLVLDLVDNKTHELLWRGIGTGAVQPSKSPQERTEAVGEAVTKILDQYPPKQK